jgi:hypothetical protein
MEKETHTKLKDIAKRLYDLADDCDEGSLFLLVYGLGQDVSEIINKEEEEE